MRADSLQHHGDIRSPDVFKLCIPQKCRSLMAMVPSVGLHLKLK